MSLTLLGGWIGVLTLVFQQFGVPIVQGDLEGFVKVASALVSLILVFYGRFRLGGVNVLGLRK